MLRLFVGQQVQCNTSAVLCQVISVKNFENFQVREICEKSILGRGVDRGVNRGVKNPLP